MFRSLITVLFLTITSGAFAATANFEDLSLPPDSFHNTTPFSSGGAGFNNSFSQFPTFSIWDGFAYSNMTDTTTPGLDNQFSAIPGHGAGNSPNYGIGFLGGLVPTITLPSGVDPVSIDVTNTTYAYFSMLEGDFFAKKFGGESGDDPDFFTLTITGKDGANSTVGHIDFQLADFTFANNSLDYIVNDWTTIDLSSLIGSQTLEFTFASTDNDPVFGMNTPAYVAVDNVVFTPEPGFAVIPFLCLLQLVRRGRTRES